MNIKFRENFDSGEIDLYKDGVVVFSDGSYSTVAKHAMNQLGVSEAQMGKIYTDYKKDFDKRCEY